MQKVHLSVWSVNGDSMHNIIFSSTGYLNVSLNQLLSSQSELFTTGVSPGLQERKTHTDPFFFVCVHVCMCSRTWNPSWSVAAVWCRDVFCRVGLPVIQEVAISDEVMSPASVANIKHSLSDICPLWAQGVFLHVTDKAKTIPSAPLFNSFMVSFSVIHLTFWPRVNKWIAKNNPLREDMNGLPVSHWQIKDSLANIYSLQGPSGTGVAQAAIFHWLPFHSQADGGAPLKLLFLLDTLIKPSAFNYFTDFSFIHTIIHSQYTGH